MQRQQGGRRAGRGRLQARHGGRQHGAAFKGADGGVNAADQGARRGGWHTHGTVWHASGCQQVGCRGGGSGGCSRPGAGNGGGGGGGAPQCGVPAPTYAVTAGALPPAARLCVTNGAAGGVKGHGVRCLCRQRVQAGNQHVQQRQAGSARGGGTARKGCRHRSRLRCRRHGKCSGSKGINGRRRQRHNARRERCVQAGNCPNGRIHVQRRYIHYQRERGQQLRCGRRGRGGIKECNVGAQQATCQGGIAACGGKAVQQLTLRHKQQPRERRLWHPPQRPRQCRRRAASWHAGWHHLQPQGRKGSTQRRDPAAATAGLVVRRNHGARGRHGGGHGHRRAILLAQLK